jgi:nitrite reductase/ring-hydroxylating ferredoxin subunit
MTERVSVCAAADLPEGERTIVEVGGREIGVFNVDGEYYALENDCCHLGGPVCTGKVSREIEAEFPGPGKRVKEQFSDNPTISCPWHGYEYELSSGEHIGVGEPVVDTFDVGVEDGTVYVSLSE